MQQETLRALKRDEAGSRPSRRLRRSGFIPAVVYGRDLETVPVSVSSRDLYVVLHTEAGLNALINVAIEGGDTVLSVAREVQRDPTRGDITHLDFIKVSLEEEIEALVVLDLLGTPVGVREDGGFVEAIENTVRVEALPTQIPTSIEADISHLTIGATLRISDLPVLEGVTYLDDPEQPLVSVLIPAVIEEPEPEELEEVLEGEEAEAAAEAAEEAAEGVEGSPDTQDEA